jgi:hypothetical protein
MGNHIRNHLIRGPCSTYPITNRKGKKQKTLIFWDRIGPCPQAKNTTLLC